TPLARGQRSWIESRPSRSQLPAPSRPRVTLTFSTTGAGSSVVSIHGPLAGNGCTLLLIGQPIAACIGMAASSSRCQSFTAPPPGLDGPLPLAAPGPAQGCEKLHHELLAEDAFLEVVLRVEQQGDGARLRLADHHLDHVTRLVRVGGDADRPLVRVQDLEAHLGVGLEDGTAPAPRPE